MPYDLAMRNKLLLLTVSGIAAIYLFAQLNFGPPAEEGWTFEGSTMGTTFTVRAADCPGLTCRSLGPQIKTRLSIMTHRLSHYEPDSELSKFNRYTGQNWFPVSQDLFNVVEYALVISDMSNGAFDITAAPAINAWGFGPETTSEIPDENSVARAIRLTGFEKVSTRAAPPALRKNDSEVTLDLSALAKGYAVDQLALLLESNGITDYLVEIGGEVRTAGVHPNGHPWRIGIESPEGGLDISFIVTPGDEAVATSGDYRNYYIVDEKRFSHTIDPATGRPVTHNLASVSVILPSAMQADALATLLMVLGPEAGLKLAEDRLMPALFFVREQNGVNAFYSSEFARYQLAN